MRPISEINIINALRNGTPPNSDFSWSCLGRDSELDAFNECLAQVHQGQSMVKMMLGDFGVGKSELISQFKKIALSKDYVIASFQVNDGFRFNKIDDLYYAIMHNLFVKHHPEGKTSFNDLFEIWLNNLQDSPFPDRKRLEVNTVCQALSQYNMNFARAFLSFMRARIQRNPEMQNVTTSWLTGEKQIPYELKQKYGLTGYVDKTNTIDFLKAFSKLLTLLDYKGLIIFVDELDLILNYRSDLRLNAYQNLKQLIDLQELEHTLFYFSGTKELIENTDKGINTLQSLSQRLNFTRAESLDPTNKRQPIMLLDPLPQETLMVLGRRIVNLYQKAYPDATLKVDDDLLMTCIPKDHITRLFITQVIAQLDSQHK